MCLRYTRAFHRRAADIPPIAFLELGLKRARSVILIESPRRNGTGFLSGIRFNTAVVRSRGCALPIRLSFSRHLRGTVMALTCQGVCESRARQAPILDSTMNKGDILWPNNLR